VIEYPEEGFAIITDSAGRYLAFQDTVDIVDLDDHPEPFELTPSSWRYLIRKDAAGNLS
jgi:hypothetical protein